MSVLALIPARAGSKGIPGKNLRQLGGKTLVQHAYDCAQAAGCEYVLVSTDYTQPELAATGTYVDTLRRPDHLCGDDVPMLAVVEHAMAWGTGTVFHGPDTIVLLLQPTQPFRQPAHLQQAIALLRDGGCDSVVSVVELPRTHSPEYVCAIHYDRLTPWMNWYHASHFMEGAAAWDDVFRRQDTTTAYRRDGTVYAFRRRTVEQHGNIYGVHCKPLLVPAEESCELDTEADWADVERRWHARHG